MLTSAQIPPFKITVIYDNRSDNCSLQEGWGFSTLIEHKDQKILFDTGGCSKTFFSNCEKLKIHLEEITHVVFSHRHWDHRAGFKEIMGKLQPKTKVFYPKWFPGFLIRKSHPKLTFKTVKSFTELGENISSLSLKGGAFLYEQSLILNTSQGTAIITGCGHPGIVNIIKTVQDKLPGKIDFVMGGFHLLFKPAHLSAEIVRECKALDIKKVAPCHCSGDHTMRQFQEAFGDNFLKIGTGSVITL